VPTQKVTRDTKAISYQQAETVMKPAAVGGNVKIDSDVMRADVDRSTLPSEAAKRCVVADCELIQVGRKGLCMFTNSKLPPDTLRP
jgi:hypothetical protein